MQGRRESKSRLNSAAQHMLTNTSLRENAEIPRKSESFKLEDLQHELTQKEMTIAALQRNYEGISHIYREEKTKSSEWFEKVNSLEKENMVLRSKIQTFESQKQKALMDLDKTQDELAKLLKGFEEVRAVKTENVTIKLQFEKKKKECDEFSHKMEMFRVEAESLRKIKIDLESVNKKLKSDAEINDKELKKLAREYEEYRVNNQALEGKYAELLNECEGLKGEINRKASQGSSVEQQLLALRQKAASDKVEFNALLNKNSELMVLIENYKDSLSQSTNKSNAAEKQRQEKIKVLNNEIYELKIKLSAIESLDYDNQLRFLQKDLESKTNELEKWKNEAKSITETLNSVLMSSQEAKKLNEDKEKQISERLGQKEEEFKRYLNDKENALAECRNKILDLAKNGGSLFEENQKLKADFYETDQMYSFTKKSLHQSMDENLKLKESLNRLISEIENLRKRLVDEIASKNKLQVLHDDNLKSLTNIAKTAEELQNQLDQSRLDSQLLEKANSEHKKKLNELESELGNSDKALLDVKERLLELESTIESNKTEISTLSQEKKQLGLSNKNLETESEKLHKIISTLNKELTDAKDSAKTSKEIIVKFEVQLSSREMEIARLENQLLIEKSNYKNSVEDNGQLVKRIQEMKEEKDRVRALDETLAKRTKNLQEREKSILKVLDRVENALNSLETNLACHSCFGPLENAVVCIPCGHLHCGNCKPTGACKECEASVKQMIQVSRFDEIYGKIVYKKQAISDMKHLLNTN